MLYDSIQKQCPEQENPERQKQMSGCQGLGEGKWGGAAFGEGLSFWGDEMFWKSDSAKPCEYTKTH